MTPTLTRAAFEAWLATYKDHQKVGRAHSGDSCPLACYLRTKTLEGVFVDDKEYRAGSFPYAAYQPLPEWAAAFVSLVDMCNDSRITAGTAREILTLIPDEGVQS